MPKLKMIKEARAEELKHNIGPNKKRYQQAKPWLDEYFSEPDWWIETTIDAPENLASLLEVSDKHDRDLENTKSLYAALKHLTPTQASESRLWTYLSHVTFLEYMYARWSTTPNLDILARYFIGSGSGSRTLQRHGLARLWWFGYTTYDKTRSDPFELTPILLKKQDIAMNIMDRSFSHNRKVTQALLTVLQEREQAGNPFYGREDLRDLTKHLIQIGGRTIIDRLSFKQLVELISKRVERKQASPS